MREIEDGEFWWASFEGGSHEPVRIRVGSDGPFALRCGDDRPHRLDPGSGLKLIPVLEYRGNGLTDFGAMRVPPTAAMAREEIRREGPPKVTIRPTPKVSNARAFEMKDIRNG